MIRSETASVYDILFDGAGFVYVSGENGEVDYGTVQLGQSEYKITEVKVVRDGERLIEHLKLDIQQWIPGRQMERIS